MWGNSIKPADTMLRKLYKTSWHYAEETIKPADTMLRKLYKTSWHYAEETL